MSASRLRSRGYAALLIGCAAVTGAMSIGLWAFPAELKAIIAEARLLASDVGLIMGGTGDPTPDSGYLSEVESLYLSQDSGYQFDALPTPEQFCPITCNAGEPDLGFGDSVNVGVSDLNNAIDSAFQGGDDVHVAVLGYSQSATIATVEMNDLISNNHGVPLNDLSFTLLGDPNSPIGGILDRFQFPDGVGAFSLSPEPQHVPFLDIPLSLATTPTDPFTTDIYTGEYDGWADFPEDPSNIFADINALIGIETVHPYYPDPTPGVNLDTSNMIDLGTIGNTTFYDIPAPLPVLAFMYDGGPAGQFFYDLFDPYASLYDDWAYGNPGDPAYGIDPSDGTPVDGSGIGDVGPWQVDATGQLMESGVAGFIPTMDPLEMLAGTEYASVQEFVGPIDALLADAGQSAIPTSVVDTLDDLSGYDLTNELNSSLITGLDDLGNLVGQSDLADTIFSGDPLISGQPLIDLVGYGFDIFNFFGA
ncbi:MAG TPA: PE-PPE domain-containing protein [Mycobacterium sp.]|uniref:PE-PPE domain-containing protein n=1 Tax=Mycobacterium sp. TaxID=1785 RepID=UPI002D3A527C|nr:PE-PPE domain-containing protein [Mycobacterium sp.]HXY66158.1 PE-PPE domain-containing protein [Mycobacterium sp.]